MKRSDIGRMRCRRRTGLVRCDYSKRRIDYGERENWMDEAINWLVILRARWLPMTVTVLPVLMLVARCDDFSTYPKD